MSSMKSKEHEFDNLSQMEPDARSLRSLDTNSRHTLIARRFTRLIRVHRRSNLSQLYVRSSVRRLI